MIQEQRVIQAIKKFCTENDQFRDMFYQAPPVAKERLAVAFYFSTFKDQFQPSDFDEYRELREQIESTMGREDLQFMIDHIGKPESVKHYQDLLAELPPDQQGATPNGQQPAQAGAQPQAGGQPQGQAQATAQ